MFLATAVIAALLVADPLSDQCAPPKYYDTYGPQKTQEISDTCVQTGLQRQNYTVESVKKYCACTTHVIESVIPFGELTKLTPEEQYQLGYEAGRHCRTLGVFPRKPGEGETMPKIEPKKTDPRGSLKL